MGICKGSNIDKKSKGTDLNYTEEKHPLRRGVELLEQQFRDTGKRNNGGNNNTAFVAAFAHNQYTEANVISI